ncbi:putative, Phosphoenolpyruvate carboxykinase (ATP) CAMK-CDPK family [Medicago truncatula]|uniref:Phosphoenolpyruvate carboxylase-related kinase n=1 Tax=Medicago truncatula TaxID=3880 RepID=G7L2X6_MEDTR|nr:phosphoenolpyruvate carboxylase kinase 2 [Medicago truncatula]AES82700.1 phosphoenolpyruvate carboxylase-related kinase [Medicago truncatula]RHN49476.1 putative, Phosphoenolpyruvate carboxykinase (ATP) CAMK-CDPK family [Medicago truncatula]
MEEKIKFEQTLEKKQFEVQKEIGKGSYGTIFQCYHTIKNQTYAVKVINKHPLANPTDIKCFVKESKIMKHLSPHPNILKIFDSFEDTDFSFIVLELCQPNYDLLERILKGPVSEQQAATYMKNLLEAIVHCHKHGIAHKDIKPDNILFDFNGNIKLADFGSAEWLFEGGKKRNECVGTFHYMAPEVILGKEHDSTKVDVWSCGVTLYVMLCAIEPFHGETPCDTFKAILKTNLRFPMTTFISMSTPATDLIKKMICRDPSKRISAEEALMHPWILKGGVIGDNIQPLKRGARKFL